MGGLWACNSSYKYYPQPLRAVKCLWLPTHSSVRGKAKNLYVFVQCEVRHLGNTAYNVHTCDKGLNPLFYSCCELGLLHWQPVNFSDCKTAKGQEGSWAVPTAPEDQGGFASCAGCVWSSFALLEVWPWVTELKGNVATNSQRVAQTRSPSERHQQGRCHAGVETEIMDVTFRSVCEERGYIFFFIYSKILAQPLWNYWVCCLFCSLHSMVLYVQVMPKGWSNPKQRDFAGGTGLMKLCSVLLLWASFIWICWFIYWSTLLTAFNLKNKLGHDQKKKSGCSTESIERDCALKLHTQREQM